MVGYRDVPHCKSEGMYFCEWDCKKNGSTDFKQLLRGVNIYYGRTDGRTLRVNEGTELGKRSLKVSAL